MDEQSWQEVSDYTSTSASEEIILTPMDTLSTVSVSIPLRGREMSQDDHHARSAFAVQALENPPANQPIENRSLMIRTRKEPHLYLSLRYGELRLLLKPASGSFWYCFRKGGWYIFRNSVSGTYLGRGTANTASANTLCAGQGPLSPSKYFTVDRDVNGGCILNVFNPSTDDLLGVSVSEDRKSSSTSEPAGEAWDLIEIKYV
ncbi:hypothetical protein ACHAPV_001109 [Trichoderma viride]